MSNNNKHIDDRADFEKMSEELFSKLEISWKKDKEQLWDELETKFETNSSKTVSLNLSWVKYAVAALVLMLLATSLFLKFYTRTIRSVDGQHLAHVLPDGSRIELNAASTISYHPYWWRFSRQVEFTGEGFFSVQKGKVFDVVSANGRTSVLGTSFNIYSRRKDYIVTCLTGRVRVEAVETRSQVILNPDEKAVLDKHGAFEISYNIDSNNTISWINNQFVFTSVPLNRVMEEISRQYKVKINYTLSDKFIYSGGFSKNNPVEEVLNLVCKPFGINFVADKNGNYVLKQNN